MTRDYSHYPLVEKALTEQRAIFASFKNGMPEELEHATTRALDMIEEHVHCEDKEDIMAVAVLMNCPPYIALKSKRFEADYSRHVQDMLDIHTTRNGITAENEDLIQVYSAMFIAHGENMLRQIRNMTQADIHWMHDIREGIDEYLDDRTVFEHKIQKGLLDVENSLIADTYAAIDLKAPKPQPGIFKKPPQH